MSQNRVGSCKSSTINYIPQMKKTYKYDVCLKMKIEYWNKLNNFLNNFLENNNFNNKFLINKATILKNKTNIELIKHKSHYNKRF